MVREGNDSLRPVSPGGWKRSMDGFRQWWATFIRDFLGTAGSLWERFARGVLHDWDVQIFLFVMIGILVIGLFNLWRRKV